MKNSLYLIFFFVFNVFNTNAQIFGSNGIDHSDIKWVMGADYGRLEMAGNFTQDFYDDATSGFADQYGKGFNMEAGYFNNNKCFVGIGGVYMFTSASVAGMYSLAQGYQKDFSVESCTASATETYYSNSIMLGPYYKASFTKCGLIYKAGIGLVRANMPDIKIDLGTPLNTTFYQRGGKSNATGGFLGVSFYYFISKKIAGTLNWKYFYTRPNFNVTYENNNYAIGRKITNYNESWRGDVMSIGLLIGI